MRWIPHKYQLRALRFVMRNEEGALFLDPGLGKTSIALMAIVLLILKGAIKKGVLIVAPLRVAHTVWPAEIEKWDQFQELTYTIVHGKDKEKNLWRNVDIKITTPDTMVWIRDQIKMVRVMPFDVLFVDESSKFKSVSTNRFKALKPMLKRFKRRYVMTGTPSSNGLLGVWAQLYIAGLHKPLGSSFSRWKKEEFVRPVFGSKWVVVPRELAIARTRKKIAPWVLRMKAEDWIKVPPIIERDVIVQLSPKSRKVYNTMRTDMQVEFEEEVTITALFAAAKSMKLHQCSNGFMYGDRKAKEVVRIHRDKIDTMFDLLEEIGEDRQVIIVFTFKEDRAMMLEYGLRKIRPDAVDIREDTDRLCKAWNDGDQKTLLAHPRSVAHGLNLQGAGGPVHIIWFSLTWSLEDYLQMNKRANRQGAKTHTMVHRLMSEGTIDGHIAKRLTDKEEEQASLINAMRDHLKG